MITSLSVLIPIYNDCCKDLVTQLHQQLDRSTLKRYEIIIAEDGSTDQDNFKINQELNTLPHCRYYLEKQNIGRSAIRNRLSQLARYEYLLFIDGDNLISDPLFIDRYIHADCNQASVIFGGISVGNITETHNLRWKYESAAQKKREMSPQKHSQDIHFTTANFMTHRSLLIQFPFDTKIDTYGYEDTLWAKIITDHGMIIREIDNPICFKKFENNTIYLSKIEESLHTLRSIDEKLQNHSAILNAANKIHEYHLTLLVKSLFILTKPFIRKILHGPIPMLWLFKCYKLGYYITCTQQTKNLRQHNISNHRN